MNIIQMALMMLKFRRKPTATTKKKRNAPWNIRIILPLALYFILFSLLCDTGRRVEEKKKKNMKINQI